MRPRGEVRLALARAFSQGPAEVKVAARRAQVGLATARYTASRMLDAGELVVLRDRRPAVFALAQGDRSAAAPRQTVEQSLDLLRSVMWGRMP